jgi:hypothetical protein
MSDNVGKKYVWVDYSIANVLTEQNTWVTLCDLKSGGRIVIMDITQNNNEGAPKTVEIEVTVNGNVNTTSESIPQGTAYYVIMFAFQGGIDIIAGDTHPSPCFFYVVYNATSKESMPYEGKSIKVRARLTSAPGTNESAIVSLVYSKLEAV